MNLRQAKGKVPIRGRGETPFLMVDFPDREVFDKFYSKKSFGNNKDKYWIILNSLRNGATMQEAGKPFALSRERVRQIEAKFLWMMTNAYWQQWKRIETDLGIAISFSQDTFSMLAKQGTIPPEDDSH